MDSIQNKYRHIQNKLLAGSVLAGGCLLIIFLLLFLYRLSHIRKHISNPPSLSVGYSLMPINISSTRKLFGVNIAGAEFNAQAFYTDRKYTGYSYFHDTGLTLMRLPFLWERLQPIPYQALSSDTSLYGTMIAAAHAAGDMVIIEPHNYGRYNNQPLTMNDTAMFSDLWKRLTQTYQNTPGIWGYELMNEPHDLNGGCQTWATLAQSAINTIRSTDTKHYILVPGYSWQSAYSWPETSGCLASLHDPAYKMIFSAHQYFDRDFSGSNYDTTICSDTNRGRTLTHPFISWLKKKHAVGVFTEYGIPGNNTCWLQTLDNFLQTLYTSPDILGGTYWAAGPAWGSYALSIEPVINTTASQIQVLKKYPSRE